MFKALITLTKTETAFTWAWMADACADTVLTRTSRADTTLLVEVKAEETLFTWTCKADTEAETAAT